jgi:uncharacterized membrane protein
MRSGRIFYIIVILVCAFEIARLWSVTPAQMAVHFDVQGNPNRFVPKAEFFRDQLETALVVVAIGLAAQIVSQVMPVQLINMPHREYWLSPERRGEVVGRMSSFAGAMFGIILLTVQAAFEISAYANLRTPIVFNARLMSLIMIAAFVVILLLFAWLVLSFRLPSSKE